MHEVDGIDDKLGQLLAVLAEARNLIVDIVLQQVAKALLVAGRQVAQLGLKVLLVEYLVDPYPVAGGLVRVRRPDAAAGRADLVVPELLLLQAVHARVQFEVDLGAVADEQVLARVGEPLLLEGGEFLEEGLDVEDDAGADQVGAFRVDEARRQEVETGETAKSMAGSRGRAVSRRGDWHDRTRRKRRWRCGHGQSASHQR